jgi:hypothetical protein
MTRADEDISSSHSKILDEGSSTSLSLPTTSAGVWLRPRKFSTHVC